jgi:hypothetical protein
VSNDNRDEVAAALEALKKRLDEAVRLATNDVTAKLHKTARGLVSQVYRKPVKVNGRYVSTGHHIGGPGSPPNMVTRNLHKKILPKPVRAVGFGYYEASIESGAEYSYDLEFKLKYAFMMPSRKSVIDSNYAVKAVTYRVRQAMRG